MAKSNLVEGICRLCREESLLNFEHVPPRSTFNKNTRYKQAPLIDYIKSGKPFERKIKGKVHQGGIGYHAFCEKCNNFLGTEYVRSYKQWAEIGRYILSKGKFAIYEYEIRDQKLNRILKQILSMFVAMNEEWFGEKYSDILAFIKNPNSKNLPEKFRVYMYLNNGTQYRYIPFMVHGNFKENEIVNLCELAFPPYGYVLTIDSKKNFNHLAEITHFKTFDTNEKVNRLLKVAKLETNVHLPLDYRTKKDILRDMEESDAAHDK